MHVSKGEDTNFEVKIFGNFEIVYRRLVLAARGKKGKAGIISLSTISFLPTSTALSTSERRAYRAGAVLGRSAARYCRGRAERPPSHAGSGQHVTITSLAGPLTPLVLLRRSPPPPRTAPAMDAPAPTWPNRLPHRQNPKAALLPTPAVSDVASGEHWEQVATASSRDEAGVRAQRAGDRRRGLPQEPRPPQVAGPTPPRPRLGACARAGPEPAVAQRRPQPGRRRPGRPAAAPRQGTRGERKGLAGVLRRSHGIKK
ncbi:hypothetical protein PVAP13_5KG046600 [Panicum virgatum]|uniref:Uncharacterized protein n=1 Tax=Panicum virgatum TaxID=38727 RepID=A0A8T0S7F2_PANVG|nr:hypothetical protein PVAP13_5KG046600 [Panicum virgatum]